MSDAYNTLGLLQTRPFAVGDKVVRVRDSFGNLKKGHIYTIKRLDRDKTHVILEEGEGKTAPASINKFILLDDWQFRKGDLVVRNSYESQGTTFIVGEVGIVAEDFPEGNRSSLRKNCVLVYKFTNGAVRFTERPKSLKACKFDLVQHAYCNPDEMMKKFQHGERIVKLKEHPIEGVRPGALGIVGHRHSSGSDDKIPVLVSGTMMMIDWNNGDCGWERVADRKQRRAKTPEPCDVSSSTYAQSASNFTVSFDDVFGG